MPGQRDGDDRTGWGPWIRHNGRGCPLPAGTLVEVVCEDCFGFAMRLVDRVSGDSDSSWDWRNHPRLKRITRYRVQAPPRTVTAQPRVRELSA